MDDIAAAVAEPEHAPTTGHRSARSQRIEVITRGERRRYGDVLLRHLWMELCFKEQRIEARESNQHHLYPEVRTAISGCSFRPEQKKSREEYETEADEGNRHHVFPHA